MTLKKISEDVYLAGGPITQIGTLEIDFLKSKALGSSRGRARINMHESDDEPLHEMFIALTNRSYIAPHYHPNKSESFHIIEGAVDVIIFDNSGDIIDLVELKAGKGCNQRYYRMSKPFFHTLIVRSEILIVHEITNGPFISGATVYADFAPAEKHYVEAESYMINLRHRADLIIGKKK